MSECVCGCICSCCMHSPARHVKCSLPCSIIGASSCTVSCRDHAHLKIQTFAVWLHAAHLWITCLFISVSHFTQFHAFCSILTPAAWIHVLALSSFFDSEVKQRLCSAHRAPPRFTHSECCLHVTPLIHCFVKVLAHQRCKYDRCSTSVTGRKKQGCLEKLHLWCKLQIQACLYGRHATEQC